MSPHLLRRWVAVALVGLGAWAGSARADDTVIVVPAKPARTPLINWSVLFRTHKQEQVVVVQKSEGAVPKQEGVVQTSGATDPNVSYDPEWKTVRPRPVRDWFDDHTRGCGCWADYNTDYNCGSFYSECVFIFGSCRHFWREPCFKSPPPSPFGPGYDCPPNGLCTKP
jgi:hypothetical protein